LSTVLDHFTGFTVAAIAVATTAAATTTFLFTLFAGRLLSGYALLQFGFRFRRQRGSDGRYRSRSHYGFGNNGFRCSRFPTFFALTLTLGILAFASAFAPFTRLALLFHRSGFGSLLRAFLAFGALAFALLAT